MGSLPLFNEFKLGLSGAFHFSNRSQLVFIHLSRNLLPQVHELAQLLVLFKEFSLLACLHEVLHLAADALSVEVIGPKP